MECACLPHRLVATERQHSLTVPKACLDRCASIPTASGTRKWARSTKAAQAARDREYERAPTETSSPGVCHLSQWREALGRGAPWQANRNKQDGPAAT